MRQAVDVLAVFDVGALSPRPIRFKVVESGIKKTVRVTDIRNIEWLGATKAAVSVTGFYISTANAAGRSNAAHDPPYRSNMLICADSGSPANSPCFFRSSMFVPVSLVLDFTSSRVLNGFSA